MAKKKWEDLSKKMTEEDALMETEIEAVDAEMADVKALGHPTYEELEQQLTEMEAKAAENWDKVLRLQAEKENAERRAKLDREADRKYGLQKIIQELLPVLDNLERSIDACAAQDVLKEGVELTLKALQAVLVKLGVEEINPMGVVFDPHLHEAVSMQEQKDVAAGTVLAVLQKGYVLHDRLIRPAMVIVAK